MKRLLIIAISVLVIMAFMGCATQPKKAEKAIVQKAPAKQEAPVKKAAPAKAVKAVLPEFDALQSRKGKPIPESWKKFDKSGKVKFLQVQTTAPASPAGQGSRLDGSYGERLIEIQASPDVAGNEVVWSLKNEGKSTVWVVAGGKTGASLPLSIAGGTTATLKTMLDSDRYTYIIVDNEGGKKLTLAVKAKIGDISAKTTRGKYMKILWF